MSLILKTDCGDRVTIEPELSERGFFVGFVPTDILAGVGAENVSADWLEQVFFTLESQWKKGERMEGEREGIRWQVIQGVETREVNGRWVCFAGLSPEASRATGWGNTEDEAAANYATAQPKPEVEPLAKEFSRILREWLTPEEMAEVNRLNASEPSGEQVCHTHDFCDPNQAMIDAWESLTGFEPQIAGMNSAFTDPVDEAWSLARKNGFYAETVTA